MIYAKSAASDGSARRETLEEHTRACLSVLHSVREALPHLEKISGEPQLWRHLFCALYLHDLGKAATGFQEVVTYEGDDKQRPRWGYRHEIVSAGFVPFLNGLDDDQRMTIALAVITHHRAACRLKKFSTLNGQDQVWLTPRDQLIPNWPFVQEWLQKMPEVAHEMFGFTLPAPCIPDSVEEVRDSWRFALKNFADKAELLPRVYAILMRGVLIGCDHLASGGNAGVLPAVDHLSDHLGRDLSGFPRPFQAEVGALRNDALLVAPTGSGKTEASLLWASNQQDAGRRIFYVLPYTASINAMQKRFDERYKLKDQVGVLHGKAAYFGYQALCEQEYSPCDAAREVREIQNLSKKIYRPIKILTPFQIIKAFFGVRGWEMQLAEFAGGIFVFDEIHVYDARTTALLLTALERLKKLGAKFLFMSATFPDFLQEKLRAIVPELIFKAPDLSREDDRRLLEAPRHQVVRLSGTILEYLEAIAARVRSGEKVLVVCNTVARAQDVFRALRMELEGIPSMLLHGRFTLGDRERLERCLSKVQLLVGTQVVEVSLDLDFDTIFTEPAPIDALIQRFGRVNRQGEKGTVPVHIFEVGGEKDRYFYDGERIARTLGVLRDGLILKQTTVVDCVNRVYETGYNEREQKTFDEVRRNFSSVANRLLPFDESADSESFYEMIRSIQVVPRIFEDDYCNAIRDKRFFDALQYEATLSLGQGMKLRKLEAMPHREVAEIKNQWYYSADVEYDCELGLLLDNVDLGGVILD
jgi:CRISPR-associated endonuclease/helicase Cas3